MATVPALSDVIRPTAAAFSAEPPRPQLDVPTDVSTSDPPALPPLALSVPETAGALPPLPMVSDVAVIPDNPLTKQIAIPGFDNSAENPNFSYTFYAEQVAPKLFTVHSGVNASIYDSGHGLVLFDTMRAQFEGGKDTANLQLAIDALFDKGLISSKTVKYIVNSHWHPDHIGGNAAFPNAEIWAGRGGTLRTATTQNIEFFQAQVPAFPTAFQPTHEVSKKSVIPNTGITIEYEPDSHTSTDVVCWLADQKVAVIGDLAITNIFPFVDVDNGGSVRGLLASLDKVIRRLPAGWKAIPGHGVVTDRNGLIAHADKIRRAIAYVQAGVVAGKSFGQIRQEAQTGMPEDVRALSAEKSADPDTRALGQQVSFFAKLEFQNSSVPAGTNAGLDACVDWIYRDLTERDQSALTAARQLAKLTTVSGREMLRIVDSAIADDDSHAASTEFYTLDFQVKELANIDALPSTKSHILSPEAKAVFAVYQTAVDAAKANHQTGFSTAQFQKLQVDMKKALAGK